jgi:GGDEF domain-containing protein
VPQTVTATLLLLLILYFVREARGALLNRADQALYRAKDMGRNRVVAGDPLGAHG